MTIDQMIEAAAKAAGVLIRRIDDGWEVRFVDMCGNDYQPNINSQQSFELAAALRISVEHNHPQDNEPWVSASVERIGAEGKCMGVECFMEGVPDESQRADRMRLAILRCAAAHAPKSVGSGGPETDPETAETRMDTGFRRGPEVCPDTMLLEGGEACPR